VHCPRDAEAQGEDEKILAEEMLDVVRRVPRDMEKEWADEGERDGGAEVFGEAWDNQAAKADEGDDASHDLGVIMFGYNLLHTD
jgi:hypothetical protein